MATKTSKMTRDVLLKRARVYTIRPGDLIIIEVPEVISYETAARIRAAAEPMFGGNKVMVLDRGMMVRIARTIKATKDGGR